MKSEQWAQWAEVIASAAIIATLVVLIWEVRGNTTALERRALLDRANAITSPFFLDPRLASASEKVRAVDGPNQIQAAFIDRYQHTEAEALVWARHLDLIWRGIFADFQTLGETPRLRAYLCGLLQSPDFALHWREGGRERYTAEFNAFVRSCLPEAEVRDLD